MSPVTALSSSAMRSSAWSCKSPSTEEKSCIPGRKQRFASATVTYFPVSANRSKARAENDEGQDRQSGFHRARVQTRRRHRKPASGLRTGVGAPGRSAVLNFARPRIQSMSLTSNIAPLELPEAFPRYFLLRLSNSQRDRTKFQLLRGRKCPIRAPAGAGALFSAPIERISALAMLLSMWRTSIVLRPGDAGLFRASRDVDRAAPVSQS